MILLGGKNAHGNILHVILGPESDFWMNLHGATLANATQVLNNMDPAQPVFIHVTKCDSETRLSEQIAMSCTAGNPYPFHVPTNVFAQNKRTPSDPKAKDAAIPTAAPATPSGKCAHCGNRSRELVPKLDPPMCYDCLRIDLMLAATRKSDPVPGNPGPSEASDANDSQSPSA